MGFLKPDIAKMEAEKDAKRLQRTIKYDDDADVRNRAAEALRNISRGEEITQRTSESQSEEIKKAEGTFRPQLMALIVGIALVLIQKELYTQTPLNLPFSVSLYFFTSAILGYFWPKLYTGLGVLVLLPSLIWAWGVLLLEFSKVQTNEGIVFGIGATIVYLFYSVFFVSVTIFGAYIGSRKGFSGK